jgi:uncharacterized protein YjbJ (UPF0337 family)
MAEEPDRLRQDIESTRASLTRDVDLLAEKTSPTRVAQRRWTAVKERVMGSAEHARHAASDTTSSAASTVQEKLDVAGDKAQEAAGAVRNAPRAVVGQAQGNPIAAGVIAFGVGLLAATLIPVTDQERRAGQQLKERGGDLTDQVRDVAGELRDDLSGSVQQAAGQVKETAREGVQATKEQAREATDQTKHAAQNAS